MSSYSEPCTWTEESVVRIKRLPTNTLGGKVRYRPSVSKGKAVSEALFVKGEGGGSLGFRSWKMSLSIWLIEGVMVVI